MEIRCKKCGRFFIADKYPNRRYCSPECNPWISTKRPSKSCKICGKDLHRKGNAGPFPTYCTEACRWEAHYKRYPKKYTKPCAYCGKPNHQKRGIVNKYCSEDCRSNDAIRNQEQQCEICGKLCGRKINKELKYPHPMSVSLDHIMPLAKGGTHEWDNLQASHLRCNMSKGARVADV